MSLWCWRVKFLYEYYGRLTSENVFLQTYVRCQLKKARNELKYINISFTLTGTYECLQINVVNIEWKTNFYGGKI